MLHVKHIGEEQIYTSVLRTKLGICSPLHCKQFQSVFITQLLENPVQFLVRAHSQL